MGPGISKGAELMDTNRKDIAIELKSVGVKYRQRRGLYKKRDYWALKDVTLNLRHGETLGIIGRNGVGKSTLLRLVAGIIRPDKGSVINHGQSVSLLALQVGFNSHLSGRENTIMSAMLQGMSHREVVSRLDDILEFSELDDFFDQPVATYSTGMRARLGFAVALHVNPDVMLIDEVLGVGDEVFKKKSSEILKERISSNHTVLIVSHNPATISDLCDRVVWIDDGVSRMEGTPEEVLPYYKKQWKT